MPSRLIDLIWLADGGKSSNTQLLVSNMLYAADMVLNTLFVDDLVESMDQITKYLDECSILSESTTSVAPNRAKQ
jgi:hypothetical protein